MINFFFPQLVLFKINKIVMALLAVGEVNYLSFLLLKQHLHPTVANNETAFIAPLERYSSIVNNTKRREFWLVLLSVHYFDS